MKINQITPIRYGQSEINKPETDFLPEEEIVIPTKQSQSSTAKILLGAGILASTAAAGITIAKNKKIKKELETALKRVTDAESKIKDAEEKVKKEIKPESEIKPKTKTIVKYIEKDNTEKLIKKYNYLFLFPSIKYVANTFIEGWEIFISTLAINAYTATNIIVLRLFTNDVIVGYYGAANKIIDSIKGILNPISLAIFPYISQQVIINKSNAILFIRKVLKCYSIFGFIMFFILFIFSDEIVSVLLGVQYEQSIILIKILSAIPFLVAISNVLGTHTLLTFGYNRIYSRILLVSALISIILIIPMSYFFSDKGAAFTMLLTEFCVTLMMYVSLRKLDIHIMR